MGEGHVFSPFTGGGGGCTPPPGQGTYPFPSQVRMGGGGTLGTYPPIPPRIWHHMEYLIRCGRYASCVHAGGLFCYQCKKYRPERDVILHERRVVVSTICCTRQLDWRVSWYCDVFRSEVSWLASTARKKKPKPCKVYEHSPKHRHPFVVSYDQYEDEFDSEDSGREEKRRQGPDGVDNTNLDESYEPPPPPKVRLKFFCARISFLWNQLNTQNTLMF